uniref:Chitin-binding type-2 domain-containing protein n=1 Tax=Timema douglasi TaxID=61478 RepID=A0A7R8VSR9_TIMDO|nr:unnamed protein product [Timema douglasi]
MSCWKSTPVRDLDLSLEKTITGFLQTPVGCRPFERNCGPYKADSLYNLVLFVPAEKPALSSKELEDYEQRQIQQWQIAVNVPPTYPGQAPPPQGAAPPGGVLIQTGYPYPPQQGYPSQPGYPQQPQPGYPQQPQPGYPQQPLPGYPQQPQPGYPQQPQPGYPQQPQPGYPQQPQPGYPQQPQPGNPQQPQPGNPQQPQPGYPQQPQPGNPQQPQPGYPQQPQPGYPQQPQPGYPQQPQPGNPQQPQPGNPQQPQPGYPQQPQPGNPQQPQPGYPQQPQPGYPQQPQPGNPQQPQPGYPQPIPTPQQPEEYPGVPPSGYPSQPEQPDGSLITTQPDGDGDNSLNPQPVPAPGPDPIEPFPAPGPDPVYPEPAPGLGGEQGGNELGPGAVPTGEEELRKNCRAPRGQFPHGSACHMYVNCWDDVVIEESCPGGLLFNEKGYCDYDYNVECGDRKIEKPMSLSENSQCPQPYGRHRSSEACNIFYVCVGGSPVKFECPEGLNYNNNLHVCDYPYRVECEGLPSVPVTASTDQPESSAGGETTLGPVLAPEQPAPVSEQPTLGAEQPAPIPGDAGRFYYPSSGLQKIPANVYRQGSSCKHNTLYRLNPSCSSVSLCKNGRTTVINCPGGYSYDTRYQRCLSSLTARCLNSDICIGLYDLSDSSRDSITDSRHVTLSITYSRTWRSAREGQAGSGSSSSASNAIFRQLGEVLARGKQFLLYFIESRRVARDTPTHARHRARTKHIFRLMGSTVPWFLVYHWQFYSPMVPGLSLAVPWFLVYHWQFHSPMVPGLSLAVLQSHGSWFITGSPMVPGLSLAVPQSHGSWFITGSSTVPWFLVYHWQFHSPMVPGLSLAVPQSHGSWFITGSPTVPWFLVYHSQSHGSCPIFSPQEEISAVLYSAVSKLEGRVGHNSRGTFNTSQEWGGGGGNPLYFSSSSSGEDPEEMEEIYGRLEPLLLFSLVDTSRVQGSSMFKSKVHLCPSPRFVYVQVQGSSMSKSKVRLCPSPRFVYVQVQGSSMSKSKVRLCPSPRFVYVQVQGSSMSKSKEADSQGVEKAEIKTVTTSSSPMTSLVLADSSQLRADGFEMLPDQIIQEVMRYSWYLFRAPDSNNCRIVPVGGAGSLRNARNCPNCRGNAVRLESALICASGRIRAERKVRVLAVSCTQPLAPSLILVGAETTESSP